MASKVVVYGGYGGIGSATAKMLHARGYDLYLVGRDEDKLTATASELGADFTIGDVHDVTLFSRVA
jgi:short-subunit dehydrogenase